MLSAVLKFSENGELKEILLYASSEPGQKMLQDSLARLFRPEKEGDLLPQAGKPEYQDLTGGGAT